MARVSFFVELALLLLLFSFFIPSHLKAGVGENVTVVSGVTIGTSNPNILSLDIEAGSITLVPNATKQVNCSAIIEDYDGESDLSSVSAELFDTSVSFYGDGDDNNYHYTNASCVFNLSYGDLYQAKVDCLFDVWYYANPGTWNCSLLVTDLSAYTDFESNLSDVQELLALGLPSTIDYGLINATFVSSEKLANLTNYGNVPLNLSLSGYGASEGDGAAMACDYGSVGSIPVAYEKYNLSSSVVGSLTLSQFEGNYSNLTTSPTIRAFNLVSRTDDSVNDVYNATYWRVYVPTGVAGTCNGTIIFGAVSAPGV